MWNLAQGQRRGCMIAMPDSYVKPPVCGAGVSGQGREREDMGSVGGGPQAGKGVDAIARASPSRPHPPASLTPFPWSLSRAAWAQV